MPTARMFGVNPCKFGVQHQLFIVVNNAYIDRWKNVLTHTSLLVHFVEMPWSAFIPGNTIVDSCSLGAVQLFSKV